MAFEVDGRKLRARREELRKIRKNGYSWSQEDVADRSEIVRRTYGDMERNPGQKFSLPTIECICETLYLIKDEVILSESPEDVRFIIPRKVDFRPARSWDAPEWEDSRVAVGLDKLGFELRPGVGLTYQLRSMSLTMPTISGEEVFRCRYLSRIAPGTPNHLGIEAEFAPQIITQTSPVTERAWTFLSDGDLGITWRQLNDTLTCFHTNVLTVQVLLFFDRCELRVALSLSVAQAHSYMQQVRRIGQPYLKFMQLEVLRL